MLNRLVAGLFVLLFALPVQARPSDDVLDLLKLDQLLEIMQAEGLAYGTEMGMDMFAGGQSAQWQSLLDQIYDIDKMETLVRQRFGEVLNGRDPDAMIAFFSTDLGRRVVELEIQARQAMIDDEVEQAARDRYFATEAGDLEEITAFIDANDLIEANVTGALNASYQFYRGLVDGGAFPMSDDEILADVWSQVDATRSDTRAWIYGFLMFAYEPLEDGQLAQYTRFSESEDGRALNRALFSGFNQMYDEISYALGLAAAQQMQGQDL